MTGAELLAYLQTLTAAELARPVQVRVGTCDYRDAHVIVCVPESIDIHVRMPPPMPYSQDEVESALGAKVALEHGPILRNDQFFGGGA